MILFHATVILYIITCQNLTKLSILSDDRSESIGCFSSDLLVDNAHRKHPLGIFPKNNYHSFSLEISS
jgi:hypothetical protein